MKHLPRIGVASFILTATLVASAATFPSDPTWNALTQLGVGIGDPLTDGSNNGREIVGDAANPAVFIYADATDFFVRLRVDTDPRQTSGGSAANLRPYGWGLLIDTDGNYADFEFSLLADGISDHIEFAENTTKTMVGDPSDKAETLIGAPIPFDDVAPNHNIRVVNAGTTFNGNPDFFIDFAVSLSLMTGAGINPAGPLVFWAGTSNDARSLSVDLSNSAGSPGPGDLGPSASDPVTIDGSPFMPQDSDGDGLSDGQENAIGTDPFDADSDDDGLLDGDELFPGQDSDGDGLINALDPDSDDDGLFDGTEMGKDCNDPATDVTVGNCIPDADAGATTTDPLDADTDDGGVSDGAEDANLDGAVDAGQLDPNQGADDVMVVDSDGDGLSDALEIFLGSDPMDADTDDDGLLDGEEDNPSADTDGDGLINVLDVDSDDDGLYDGTELGKDCSDPATDPGPPPHCIADADAGATTTSMLKADTDDGGVSDGSEDHNLNGAIDPGELDPNLGSDDATSVDTDGDGLSDGLEVHLGTDPMDADSDDDGVIDGEEPNPGDDHDGDGLINALDPDSDDDGLFDGTEMGKDCSDAATDLASMTCIPDGDGGATTTNPLDADTDDGGVSDGDEDTDKDGVIDAGETDPNEGSDDVVPECATDADCGGPMSGKVCDDAMKTCIDGCRGLDGNGCPDGLVCTSADETIGTCVRPGTGGMGGMGGEGGDGGTGGVGGTGGSGGAGAAGGGGSAAAGGNAEDAGAVGGCGCRTVGSPHDSELPWLLLLSAIALGRRRPRRR